jgi:hypothetical protein
MTAIEISDKPRISSTAQQGPHRPASSTYWLIARPYYSGMEPLTLTRSTREGEFEVLPVFSYHEEAEMFLHLGGALGVAGADHKDHAGWHVRQSEGGELISLLRGRCAGIKEVALDPLPQMIKDMTVELVSVLRERFIRRIMMGGDTSAVSRPPVLYDPDRGEPPREGEWRRRDSQGWIARQQFTRHGA